MKRIVLIISVLFLYVASYGQLVGEISPNEGRTARLDASTWAQIMIPYEHHEVHSGEHFFLTDVADLGSGDSLVFGITTPNTTKWAHMQFTVSSSAQANVYFIENVDSIYAGTAITPHNNNRNSTDTSALIIVNNYTSVDNTVGDTLITLYLGSGTNPSERVSGSVSRDHEIILKQNTKYIVQINSGAASNRISYDASWYEHTDKN